VVVWLRGCTRGLDADHPTRRIVGSDRTDWWLSVR